MGDVRWRGVGVDDVLQRSIVVSPLGLCGTGKRDVADTSIVSWDPCVTDKGGDFASDASIRPSLAW